jgi:phage terminase large subunit-like protein
MLDSLTKRWIQSAADERAAADGCRFDEAAGLHVVEFFRRFLRHSKGEWAGRPFELLDWQRDGITMPLFGWKRPDGTRRFRKTYIEIPKKNGKSTLASGVGLYLLVGDGEPGAEIYSAATDQQQASIVHGEAIHMVESSPELSSVLQINQSTKTITYLGTKSVYKALSKEANSKEGLNAHGIIADELHAWYGRKLWDALKYAFRARRQGLLFVITTAGEDELSVCYEQYEYAKSVLSGAIHDDRFFAFIREAGPKDDWTDIEVARRANPSLGITIQEDEFRADIAEAQKTLAAQATFKRYSLNIWSTGVSPWLSPESWAGCFEKFSEADLLGRPCFGGLDLAKTRDMTAFVLCFPDGDDRYLLLPYFWLPEETANNPDAPVEYRVWAEEGLIELTPGNVCDYGFVKKQIVAASQKFALQDYAYDPWNAEHLTQELQEEHDLKRFEFRQTLTNFAAPTAEFERLVVGGGLKQNGHAILSAQAGWVNVYINANGDRRPIKPKKRSHRKIDGIVAGIMALARAMKGSAESTVTESVLIY